MAPLADWWGGARPRTLGAGLLPVLAGAAAADRFIAVAVRRGAPRGRRAAGRRELRERLLRWRAWRRLGRTAGPSPADRVRTRRPAGGGGRRARVARGRQGSPASRSRSRPPPALILAVGALALLAVFLYSGGPRPYAGLGLGEIAVFVFFGLMATAGTNFVMDETVAPASWWAGSVLGLLAVAILVANNLRDIPTDERAGSGRWRSGSGSTRTRTFYRLCVSGAFALIAIGFVVWIAWEPAGLTPWALFGLRRGRSRSARWSAWVRLRAETWSRCSPARPRCMPCAGS